MAHVEIGDAVHVRATVMNIDTREEPPRLQVQVDGDWAWVVPASIVKVEPRAFRAGDRVQERIRSNDTGTVVCVVEQWVWVRMDGSSTFPLCTYALDRLERIP